MPPAKAPANFRKFRAPADLWERFGTAVANSPDPEADMSKVLRQFLRWYTGEPGAQQPERPSAGPWSTPQPAPDSNAG